MSERKMMEKRMAKAIADEPRVFHFRAAGGIFGRRGIDRRVRFATEYLENHGYTYEQTVGVGLVLTLVFRRVD